MTHEITPLESVRHNLWRHTDRNPADATAVMDTIHEALGTLDEHQEKQLAQGLVKSLDPHTSGGLGVTGYQALEHISTLPTDEGATRVQQWGALSLLGVLASTHNAAIHVADAPDPAAYRAQLASTTARRALSEIIAKTTEPEHRAVAKAFLERSGVSAEDVATEFILEGLERSRESEDETQEECLAPPVDPSDLAAMGSAIGEPRPYGLDIGQDSVRKRFDAMDWLDSSLDITKLAGRDIYHDGERVATIVDLTVGHGALNKLAQELYDNKRHSQFWPQMAAEIVRYRASNTANRLPIPKVPTMYMSSGKDANVNLVRGYYTPLGKEPETNVDVFGLIAAYCTKGPQLRVLRIISRSAKRASER